MFLKLRSAFYTKCVRLMMLPLHQTSILSLGSKSQRKVSIPAPENGVWIP